MNIKPLLEDPINLFHYLQHPCLFCECCAVGMCVCVPVSLITGHPCEENMHNFIVRHSKASVTLYVCGVRMNLGLQLGRHNNYKCIWNPTALMLSIIAFSSKLQESAWNHVFFFVLWGQIVTALEQLQKCSRKLPWNSLTYCVCLRVCAGVSFDDMMWVVWLHSG